MESGNGHVPHVLDGIHQLMLSGNVWGAAGRPRGAVSQLPTLIYLNELHVLCLILPLGPEVRRISIW